MTVAVSGAKLPAARQSVRSPHPLEDETLGATRSQGSRVSVTLKIQRLLVLFDPLAFLNPN